MYYRILLPYQCIGTIDKLTYDTYRKLKSTRAQSNQHVRTLITNSYTDYQFIRGQYKKRAAMNEARYIATVLTIQGITL